MSYQESSLTNAQTSGPLSYPSNATTQSVGTGYGPSASLEYQPSADIDRQSLATGYQETSVDQQIASIRYLAKGLTHYLKNSQDYTEVYYVSRLIALVYDMEDLARLIPPEQHTAFVLETLDAAEIPPEKWNRWLATWGIPEPRKTPEVLEEIARQEVELIRKRGFLIR